MLWLPKYIKIFCNVLMLAGTWGEEDERFEVKGATTLKIHRFWHILFTAYGRFYCCRFVFPFLYFLSFFTTLPSACGVVEPVLVWTPSSQSYSTRIPTSIGKLFPSMGIPAAQSNFRRQLDVDISTFFRLRLKTVEISTSICRRTSNFRRFFRRASTYTYVFQRCFGVDSTSKMSAGISVLVGLRSYVLTRDRKENDPLCIFRSSRNTCDCREVK